MTARKKRRSAGGVRRVLFFYARHLGLWLLLGGVGYWFWIDAEVGRSASLRNWQLPARIFGAPQELFVGTRLGRSELESALQRLGYVRRDTLAGAGEYSRAGNAIGVYLRAFEFSDGLRAARNVTIGFSGERIASIVDARNRASIPLLRLEPEEIGAVHGEEFEDRVLLNIDDVPARFLEYLVAIEDRRFHDHFGVDVFGIARAALKNLIAGRVTEGGSTITQQLVKNLYLSRARSVGRKIREAMIAVSLERRFSKREILEAYINEIFLGQSGNRAIHGFGLAARFYFGQPLGELSLAQTAMLVGMIKAPSAYNPRRHPEAAAARLRTVLDVLLARELIDPREHARAVAADLGVVPVNTRTPGTFAAVNDLIRAQLRRDYREEDLKFEGLRVFTTIDPRIQAMAGRVAAGALAEVEQNKGITPGSLELAVVVIDPRTAEIIALVGGRDGSVATFNHALNARRPFGSLVKPFVYSAALDQSRRFNVTTRLRDEEISVPLASGGVWTPKNYDGKVHGMVTVTDAFARSINLASVDLGLRVGVDVVARRLHEMGLERKPVPLPSLLLGAVEVTPIEVARLYQGIANDGFKVPLRAIRNVSDPRNATLSRYPPRTVRVLSAPTAFLVQYLMSETVRIGTARSAASALPDSMPLAGKTGTSNDGRDSWFAGFGDDYLVVVWVGRDDNGSTGLTGSSGALRIWTALMRALHVAPFEATSPDGIEWHTVAATGGVIVPDDCDDAVRVPLAVPHGLAVANSCGGASDGDASLWQRMRGMFR